MFVQEYIICFSVQPDIQATSPESRNNSDMEKTGGKIFSFKEKDDHAHPVICKTSGTGNGLKTSNIC